MSPLPVEFRNVVGTRADPVTTWPFEGLVETIEQGLVTDWKPVIAEIKRAPWGVVARRVERWTAFDPQDATALLFTLVVAHARDDAEHAERDEVASRVRHAIARSGLTAADFAREIGTSASRLSTYATGRVTPSAAMLVRIEAAHLGQVRLESGAQ